MHNTSSSSLLLKRGGPDTAGGDPSSIRTWADAQPPTQAQVRDGWLSRLEHTPHGEIGHVETVLDAISHGNGMLEQPSKVNAAFNTLIQHEEYGVFVEVFKAWCMCCGTPEAPFQASLDLALPPDWIPTRPAEMENAFSEIQVQRVKVTSHADTSDPIRQPRRTRERQW